MRAVLVRTAIAMIFVVLLASAVSSAQTLEAAAAETLFSEARRAMEAGKYDIACAKFRESDRLDPAAGTKLNLAGCEQKRGKLAAAWALFRTIAEDPSVDAERREIATKRSKELDKQVPRLTVTLAPHAPADSLVRLGKLVLKGASFGTSLPIDPGKHELEVEAAGHQSRHFTISVVAGQHATLTVEPGPAIPASTRPASTGPASTGPDLTLRTPDAPTDSSTRMIAGLVVGGFGLAGLAIGTATGIATLDKKSVSDEHCNDTLQTCDQQGIDASQAGRTLGIVTTVGLVSGAVGLTTGLVLLLIGDDEARPEHAKIVLGAGPGQVTLHGRF